MNHILQTMLERGSVRSFDPTQKLSPETLETILKAAQQSPTSISGQQYSVIVIEDEAQKDKLLEYTMSSSGLPQQHVKDCSVFLLFLIDFHKTDLVLKKEGSTMGIHHGMEGLLIGSVDVGISLGAATAAAEALGLGTVAIGAIRRSAEDIIKEFKLPQYTFPVVGLCIGYPLDNIKPAPKLRLPLSSFAHKAHYQVSDLNALLDKYNKEISESMNAPDFKWTSFIASFYNRDYNPHLLALYEKQGFKI